MSATAGALGDRRPAPDGAGQGAGPAGGAGVATIGRPLPPPRNAAAASFRANATIVEREDLTASVARFVIRPDEGIPAYEPGQYFALGLPVDGRLLQRPYSTSTAPDGATSLEFLVRLVRDGAFTPRLWTRRPGDRLRLGRPKGLFTLQPGDDRTHLLISTGTGLAPFIAMADLLRRRPERPGAIVVHGVAAAAELAYRDRLERWATEHPAFGYLPAVSRPDDPANAGWTGATGRVDAALPTVWAIHRLDPATTVAYLCGNPGMIRDATVRLRELGLPEDAIVSEHYWADPVAGAAD